MDPSLGLKYWELDNCVELVDPKRDSLYAFDAEQDKAQRDQKPWLADKHYFRRVRISAVALIKMVMHARSGGELEVMGMMQGRVDGDSFVITDAFRLPVEGTETRVNAHEEAYEYLVNYTSMGRAQGARQENVVGWYHSHPGYGCWLSGIDVSTQQVQQQFQDPFLAVVIDPDRTINAGKVEIGAFRTIVPAEATITSPTAAQADLKKKKEEEESDTTDKDNLEKHVATNMDTKSVPLAKAADFGAHASKYYSLEVSHFKSTLDTVLLEQLWSKYWAQTLSQSPLLSGRDFGTKQLENLAERAEGAAALMGRGRTAPGVGAAEVAPSVHLRNMAELRIEVLGDAVAAAALRENIGLAAFDVKRALFGQSNEKRNGQ